MSGDTILQAGSLLDDNQWHEVEMTRTGREIHLTVDRLTIKNITNGEFYQLDLDRYVSFLNPYRSNTICHHKLHYCLGKS